MAKIIAIANHKGGVSKTATVQNLGKALALQGNRTLLLDFDPQGNLSQNYGQEEAEATIKDAIEGAPLPLIPMAEYLDLCPCDLDLDYVDEKLKSDGIKGYERLSEVLAPVKHNYDYILIDCPPSVRGMIVPNAFIAASSILIPVVPEKGAVKGLNGILALYSDCLKLNPALQIEGFLFTRVKPNTALHISLMKTIKREYQDYRIFNTMIQERIAMAETGTMETDIFNHAPKSPSTEEFFKLAKELTNGKEL